MTLSYGTNISAVLAVCKNFEFLQHLPHNQTLCIVVEEWNCWSNGPSRASVFLGLQACLWQGWWRSIEAASKCHQLKMGLDSWAVCHKHGGATCPPIVETWRNWSLIEVWSTSFLHMWHFPTGDTVNLQIINFWKKWHFETFDLCAIVRASISMKII